jgi:hypothetical protein
MCYYLIGKGFKNQSYSGTYSNVRLTIIVSKYYELETFIFHYLTEAFQTVKTLWFLRTIYTTTGTDSFTFLLRVFNLMHNLKSLKRKIHIKLKTS